MRRPLLGLALVMGFSLFGPSDSAHAQISGDPFNLYFGFYLPQQAAVAARSTPLDTINAATEARQPVAVDRGGLYDPTSPFSEEELDPLRSFSSRGQRERIAQPARFPSNTTMARAARLSHAGPYYNRTGQYFANMPSGMGANKNLAVTRGVRRRGAGGMPGMGMSMGMGIR